ncbi:UMP/CMP kinase [Ranunculus cassubicifolius]
MDTSLLTHTHFTSKPPKSKLTKRISHKQLNPTTSTSLSYPKSTLTPIHTSQTPYTQTKHQALDAVINDIESSINRGIAIDTEIFSSLLETCFQIQSIAHGIKIHKLIPPKLLRDSVSLSSKVLRLYASCGVMDTAHQVFDEMSRRKVSAFPWNSLISGYAELGRYEDALALYFQMEEEGVQPDQFTFPRVLKACAGLGSIRIGEAVHRSVVRCGFCRDVFILNALVDMYSKCGDIVKARKVFDKIVVRDSVSWNSMLISYVHHGLLVQALDVFRGMLRAGFEPDSIALSTVLSKLSSSKVGFEVHAWLLRRGNIQNLSIANSLITLYSEKRKLAQSRWLFERMVERDVVSWNSIISGHRKHPLAITYFQQMEKSNILPDNVTFMSLLSTCAHLGRVEEGTELFVKMKNKYGINPCMEHYACMVNLLGRAGLINDAYEIIMKEMKFEAGPTVWGALLFACSLHGNVDVGEISAGRLFDLEPDNVHNFELLIEIYGKAGKWNKVEKVMQSMVERGLDS